MGSSLAKPMFTIGQNMYVFELWEETEVHGEKPGSHGNWDSSKRPSCLKVKILNPNHSGGKCSVFWSTFSASYIQLLLTVMALMWPQVCSEHLN